MSQGDPLGDLAFMNYQDLLAQLEQDLVIDANTGILPGSAFEAVSNDAGPYGSIQTPDKQALAGYLGAALTGAGPEVLAQFGIARGQVTLTWAGNAYSNQVAVTHDLGAVPTYVGVSDTATGGPYVIAGETTGFTTSQFTAQAAFVNGATWTGSKTVGWVAIL